MSQHHQGNSFPPTPHQIGCCIWSPSEKPDAGEVQRVLHPEAILQDLAKATHLHRVMSSNDHCLPYLHLLRDLSSTWLSWTLNRSHRPPCWRQTIIIPREEDLSRLGGGHTLYGAGEKLSILLKNSPECKPAWGSSLLRSSTSRHQEDVQEEPAQ